MLSWFFLLVCLGRLVGCLLFPVDFDMYFNLWYLVCARTCFGYLWTTFDFVCFWLFVCCLVILLVLVYLRDYLYFLWFAGCLIVVVTCWFWDYLLCGIAGELTLFCWLFWLFWFNCCGLGFRLAALCFGCACLGFAAWYFVVDFDLFVLVLLMICYLPLDFPIVVIVTFLSFLLFLDMILLVICGFTFRTVCRLFVHKHWCWLPVLLAWLMLFLEVLVCTFFWFV